LIRQQALQQWNKKGCRLARTRPCHDDRISSTHDHRQGLALDRRRISKAQPNDAPKDRIGQAEGLEAIATATAAIILGHDECVDGGWQRLVQLYVAAVDLYSVVLCKNEVACELMKVLAVVEKNRWW
jgi:hypothetical protein